MKENNIVSDGTPLLSVVMPVYKVENYLRLAVDSVLGQTYRNIELILVDDGSPDSCGQICDEYASIDSRVRVIHQDNGGLSNARNNGAAVATGQYLAFIDSDDELWDNSYARMMGSARRTGSQIVTGNVHRMKDGRRWQAWNQKLSHARDINRTNLLQTPELIYDGTAWNKIFEMEFWREHNFSFPEGMLYEDMLPMYQALRAASSVDVLMWPVYKWRIRSEQDSITQQRGEIKSLHDRYFMMKAIHADLLEIGDPGVLEHFLTKCFDGDLWLHVEFVGHVSPDYDKLLSDAVAYFWPHVSDEVKLSLPQERRPQLSALARGEAHQVQHIRRWYAENRYNIPTEVVENKLYIKQWPAPRFIRLLSAPERELNRETAIDSVITHLEWLNDTTYRIRGWAYVPYVAMADQELKVFAQCDDRVIFAEIKRVLSPEASERSKDPFQTHETAGFIADFDTESIGLASTGRKKKSWELHVEVSTPELTRTRPLDRVWRGGSAPVIGAQHLPDGRRVVPVASAGQVLRLDVRDPRVLLRTASIDGRRLRAQVEVPLSSHVKGVKLVSPDTFQWVRADWTRNDMSLLELVVDVPKSDEFQWLTWSFEIDMGPRKTEVAMSPAAQVDGSASENGLGIVQSPRGWARVRDRTHYAVVDHVDVSDDLTVTLAGHTTEPDHALSIGLAIEGQERPTWFEATIEGNRFSASLKLTRPDCYGIQRPWKPAKHILWAKQHNGNKPVRAFVALDESAAIGFPRRFETPQMHVQFDRARQAGVTMNLTPAIPCADKSAHARATAMFEYGEGAIVVPENSVFFRTDMGGSAGDSALYIHRELLRRNSDLKLYWGVKDHSVPVPPGGIAVIDGTQTWLEKLAKSKYVVNNYGGLWGYAAHSHQTYLQTWHGTPYKVIGMSEWTAKGISEDELDLKRREAAAWDILLSPNPYCSELLPKELLYDGPILELGMPRNDFSVTATAGDRDRVRHMLGLAEGTKVALYAPTFRESLRNSWSATRFDELDLYEMQRKLGSEWVVLNRGHSFNARARSYAESRQGVVDVTDYADIAELYAIADVCITDYSSVMFDFVATGRPLLFFVPDMESYIASRPTYFDLAEVAPSRLCRTSQELYSELQGLDTYFERNGAAYAAFREKFVPWEDGQAARRVVDAVFGTI